MEPGANLGMLVSTLKTFYAKMGYPEVRVRPAYFPYTEPSLEIEVKVTDMSPPGTVFTSFSFADVPVNILTGSGYDPVTDTAELKVCPVRVEPVE